MMIRLLQRTGAALALLIAPAALAQTPAPTPVVERDADPALWVVKDADTTIYLFGTVHALKPGLRWFDEAVKAAFDASGELVTEVGVFPDPATTQGIFVKLGLDASGKPLTQKLPEDKREMFRKAVEQAGLPLAAIERFEPWFAATQITAIRFMQLGYDREIGVDATLTAAAQAAKKPISGLETVEQQLGYFDALPEAAQINYLIEGIEQLDKMDAVVAGMMADWAKGDAKALARLMNQSLSKSPQLTKALLTDRNAHWAQWIATRMDKPGVVFVAVGAGHLAGKDSVQDLLKKRKIRAKRVKY